MGKAFKCYRSWFAYNYCDIISPRQRLLPNNNSFKLGGEAFFPPHNEIIVFSTKWTLHNNFTCYDENTEEKSGTEMLSTKIFTTEEHKTTILPPKNIYVECAFLNILWMVVWNPRERHKQRKCKKKGAKRNLNHFY